jgi:hypothetical protein
MRRFLIIAAALCSAGYGSAQKLSEAQAILKTLEGEGSTYEGRIVLNDGTEEQGTITYNDRTAIVSFKSGSHTGTYSARNLTSFDFYDNDARQQRTFFSMEYETRDGGSRTSQFFEIVRQYTHFAVLTKTDPVSINKKTGVVEALALGDYEQNRVVVSNAMTIYFISEDLSVQPYLEVSSKDVSHVNRLWRWDFFSGESTRVRILDNDLPKKLMGDHYKKVVEYIKRNKLDWGRKDDLISILDYYDSLTDQ